MGFKPNEEAIELVEKLNEAIYPPGLPFEEYDGGSIVYTMDGDGEECIKYEYPYYLWSSEDMLYDDDDNEITIEDTVIPELKKIVNKLSWAARTTSSGSNTLVSIDDVIDLLNDIATCDPEATTKLFETSVPCNETLAVHDSVLAGSWNGGGNRLGMLGIINGIFGVNDEGRGQITAVYEGDEEKYAITEFRLRKGIG